jgi:hypothetical protein
MLQVARYLLKGLNRIQRGSKKELDATLQYLRLLEHNDKFTLDTDDHSKLRNPENLIKAYQNNSCYRVKKAG